MGSFILGLFNKANPFTSFINVLRLFILIVSVVVGGLSIYKLSTLGDKYIKAKEQVAVLTKTVQDQTVDAKNEDASQALSDQTEQALITITDKTIEKHTQKKKAVAKKVQQIQKKTDETPAQKAVDISTTYISALWGDYCAASAANADQDPQCKRS